MEQIKVHEIPGFKFGQIESIEGGTGCTVILCPHGAVTGVDVRGGSPGTRDTDALDPVCNREVVHSVVLTGGEPTLAKGMPELVAALKDRGYWIAVETNGTNYAEWLQFVDYIACSPKAEFPDALALVRADEVRVVASSEDIVGFCQTVRNRIAATDYYVSPCERGGEIDFATAKSVLSLLDGWSLSVQLHKLLGFR